MIRTFTEEERVNHLNHYIGTVLWSSLDDTDNEYECLDGAFDIDDFDKDTLKSMDDELRQFIDDYYYLVDESDMNKDLGRFVHDFWLTRNGHGAGYWDGGYKHGEKLTDAANRIGCLTLYVGDDGKIYATV